KTILVCPKYFLPYWDGLHLSPDGYRWLGEYYAKAYYQQMIAGQQWSPLRPIAISRNSNVVSLTFTGAVGNLVLDTNLVTDPQGTIYDPTAFLGAGVIFVGWDPNLRQFTLPGHNLQPGNSILFHED